MPLATRLSSPRKVLLTPSRNSSSSLLGQGIAFSLITLASLWFSLCSSAKLRAQQAPATSPWSLKQVPAPLVLSYSPQVENSSSWSTMNSLSLPALEMWVLTCTRPQMKKNTSSSLSPSAFKVLPFSNLRCSMDSATCIFSRWVRLLKYSFTSMKCTHFFISSPRVKFFLTAPSFILITLHPSAATTRSLRFSSPNRISVCPNTRSTPNYLLAPSSEDTSTLPSSTTQMYLYRPPSPSLLYMSAPLSQATASWLMQRLTKCSDVVSKNRLKKGRRARDLAISMPSKGIFSYSSLESTLKICCISPRTSRLLSSISILIQSIVTNAPKTLPPAGHPGHPRGLPPPLLRVGEASEEQLDRQRHHPQPPRHPLPREEPLPPPLCLLPTRLVVRAVPNVTPEGQQQQQMIE